jgi:hypothetical protein
MLEQNIIRHNTCRYHGDQMWDVFPYPPDFDVKSQMNQGTAMG